MLDMTLETWRPTYAASHRVAVPAKRAKEKSTTSPSSKRVEHLPVEDAITPSVEATTSHKPSEKNTPQAAPNSTGAGDGNGGISTGGGESKGEEFEKQVVDMVQRMKAVDDEMFARVDEALTSMENAFLRR